MQTKEQLADALARAALQAIHQTPPEDTTSRRMYRSLYYAATAAGWYFLVTRLPMPMQTGEVAYYRGRAAGCSTDARIHFERLAPDALARTTN